MWLVRMIMGKPDNGHRYCYHLKDHQWEAKSNPRVEDTETKPDVAVRKATKLLEEDGVDFLVGSSSSGDTLAVLLISKGKHSSCGRI